MSCFPSHTLTCHTSPHICKISRQQARFSHTGVHLCGKKNFVSLCGTLLRQKGVHVKSILTTAEWLVWRIARGALNVGGVLDIVSRFFFVTEGPQWTSHITHRSCKLNSRPR